MKRLFFMMFALPLLLAGCQSNDQESSPSDNISGETKQGSSILSPKEKYGTASDKSIMPMYNAAQNEEFTFKFKADLRNSSLSSDDIISVHTDIKGLKASKVYALPEIYDPDADKLTLLDKPIIIPFTVKSELPVPKLRYEIDKDRRLALVWDKVEGASQYKIYKRIDRSRIFDPNNLPLQGAENAYSESNPLVIATTTETTFNDFMKDGRGGLGIYNDIVTTKQNFGIQGEYYVTAIGEGKESNFSNGSPAGSRAARHPGKLCDAGNKVGREIKRKDGIKQRTFALSRLFI
ncbi:hypothetical protein [Paenibacillus sp. FSL R7-0652]|uniref:hypothetical protein n=1 Tax=Paenibacillus sp. FSL R7-0652 TaxID=2921687 RepID=UPI00315B0404